MKVEELIQLLQEKSPDINTDVYIEYNSDWGKKLCQISSVSIDREGDVIVSVC